MSSDGQPLTTDSCFIRKRRQEAACHYRKNDTRPHEVDGVVMLSLWYSKPMV